MTIDDNTFVLGVIVVGVAAVAIIRNVTRAGIEVRRITAREYEQRKRSREEQPEEGAANDALQRPAHR